MAANILLSDLTNGSLDANNDWTGTAVFDVLMKAVNSNIEGQYNKGRITSTDYATVYIGGLQSVIAQSMQFLLQKLPVEAQLAQSAENLQLAEDVHTSKMSLAANQANKIISDIGLINAQKDGIVQQVIDNRKIKALNSLANTYGTFGAGGLTLSSDMWTTYFNLASDLSGVTAPTGTTVSRV